MLTEPKPSLPVKTVEGGFFDIRRLGLMEVPKKGKSVERIWQALEIYFERLEKNVVRETIDNELLCDVCEALDKAPEVVAEEWKHVIAFFPESLDGPIRNGGVQYIFWHQKDGFSVGEQETSEGWLGGCDRIAFIRPGT